MGRNKGELHRLNQQIRKESFKDILNSSAINRVRAVFMAADAVEIMDLKAFQTLAAIYRRNGYILRENETLSGINEYCRLRKNACVMFEDRFEKMITNTTFNCGGFRTNDNFRSGANEIARLVMKYIDVAVGNDDNRRKVFELLDALPSSGIFSQEDINDFIMK